MGAGLLFVLFAAQMVLPETRAAMTAGYGVLTVVVLLLSRRQIGKAFRWIRS